MNKIQIEREKEKKTQRTRFSRRLTPSINESYTDVETKEIEETPPLRFRQAQDGNSFHNCLLFIF